MPIKFCKNNSCEMLIPGNSDHIRNKDIVCKTILTKSFLPNAEIHIQELNARMCSFLAIKLKLICDPLFWNSMLSSVQLLSAYVCKPYSYGSRTWEVGNICPATGYPMLTLSCKRNLIILLFHNSI